MKKSAVLLISLLFLTLGAGCTDTVLPPTSDTAHEDWQTYTNVEHGFSLQYPSDTPVDLVSTAAALPPAVGDKERSLKINLQSASSADLDEDGCLAWDNQTPDRREKQSAGDFPVCLTVLNEGAAGSTYRTYHYTTRLGDDQIADIAMTIRYPTSVRVYEDCAEDADQATQYCKDLAFDEERDTKLFSDIMDTLKKL